MIQLYDATGEWGHAPDGRPLRAHVRFGVVPLDKPCGPSSHEAASFVRKLLHAKKAGHTGTLDANVSGVLPVLLDESTKASNFLLKDRKTYACLMKSRPALDRSAWEAVFGHFRGKIYQKPPVASAVAKRLRVREVHRLDVLEVDGPRVLFTAEVSAGTYIRTLVFHAGEVAAVETEMAELRRTDSAGIPERACVTLQDVSDAQWRYDQTGDEAELRRVVRPLEHFIRLPRVVVADDAIKPISSGANLAIPGIPALDEGIARGDRVQVVSLKGEIVCFGRALLSSDEIQNAGETTRHGLAVDVERVLLHE